MHGCNGYMGQVITGLIREKADMEIVAGIDLVDCRDNGYPVYSRIRDCQVEADVIIDFASAKATDALLAYGRERKIPMVLCTTGLTEEQLAAVEETSREVAVLQVRQRIALGVSITFEASEGGGEYPYSRGL